MAEERRFAELPRDAVRKMAEGAGTELSEEGAALLAEDVCYRLREAAQVKSVSHDLEQLRRLLQVARCLVLNPFLCLGSYGRSLVGSVLYCALEPLAASINPRNDHWTLRDSAAVLLGRICRLHGDQLSGLHPQVLLALQKVLADPVRPLCSHYGAVVGLHALGWKAVERVLFPHLPSYGASLQAVLDDNSVSNAQVKADGHKVYGAILVAVERLLKTKAHHAADPPPSPWHSPHHGDPPPDPTPPLGRPLGGGVGNESPPSPPSPPPISLYEMYRDLYDFFGDSLALRFGTGSQPTTPPHIQNPPYNPDKEPYGTDTGTGTIGGGGGGGSTRKMPQLTANSSPPHEDPLLPRPTSHRPSFPSRGIRTGSGTVHSSIHRVGIRDIFQKCRFNPRGPPRFSFIITGRQTGRRCQGRRFQTLFTQYHSQGGGHVPTRYVQKLPVIGRAGRPTRRRFRPDYSLLFLL
ncbi:TAF6-like RNA polymerase II p300/CBP-associated factor-associated factor 65 kDa subunit 6L [Coturnix japonica]|nr:TAF6-like RNA polymerase II p300/CBP-associated factor-associated factor 65 kDa subunit 6L [Coturnix japonica]